MCFRGLPEVLGDDLRVTHCETCVDVTILLPIVAICVPNSHKEADNIECGITKMSKQKHESQVKQNLDLSVRDINRRKLEGFPKNI